MSCDLGTYTMSSLERSKRNGNAVFSHIGILFFLNSLPLSLLSRKRNEKKDESTEKTFRSFRMLYRQLPQN